MYAETDPRVIHVLDVARGSSSRVVRLRAVCMMANLDFEQRADWLSAACSDSDLSVRQAAMAVTSWTLVVAPPEPEASVSAARVGEAPVGDSWAAGSDPGYVPNEAQVALTLLTEQAPVEATGDPRMITLRLHSTGDRERDARRMRRVHGLLTSYPGRDRFVFHVYEASRRYHLEFPNSTTGYCADLRRELQTLLG